MIPLLVFIERLRPHSNFGKTCWIKSTWRDADAIGSHQLDREASAIGAHLVDSIAIAVQCCNGRALRANLVQERTVVMGETV